jgi:cobalt-zinc-cadmium efflux system membrane fusion protein
VVVESRLAGDPPPNVILKAPMSGWIAAVNLALGQPVSPDAALIEIVDLAEVHAVAAVPEHLVGRLKLGNRARLRVSALPGREFEAELAHFAAEADAVSGTLDAAFHVANPDSALRPGMRAEFSIVVDSRPDVLAVPREAIQGDLGSRSVFLREPERTNAFVRVPVVLGMENDRQVEVLRGLKEGDEVVSRGAYSLAFAGRGAVSLRASLDAAHGHAHNEDGSEKEEADADGTETHADHGPEDGQDHAHDHDHDHGQEEANHDDDHDHDGVGQGRGSGQPGTWTIFFASTTALLLVLLILSVVRSRTVAAVGTVSGTTASDGRPDSKRTGGDSHA